MTDQRPYQMSHRSSGETTACEWPNSRNDFSHAFEQKFNEEMHRGLHISENPESPSVVLPTSNSPGRARESVLVRGLQVPTKSKNISSGFIYPSVLERAGISKESWLAFTNEIVQHANMDASQWMTVIGKSALALGIGSIMVGFFGAIPAVVVGQKMRKKQEKQNFMAANESGALIECIKRWNETFFLPRRLIVRVDVPGNASDMASMDISTSKTFHERSTVEVEDRTTNAQYSDAQIEESRARMKAVQRGRIVIIPLDTPDTSGIPEFQSSTTSRDDLEGRTELKGDAESDKILEASSEAVTMFRPAPSI